MNFISSRTQISNLVKLDTNKTICSDSNAVFFLLQGSVTATVGKEVFDFSSEHALITPKRDICYFSGKGRVLGFSFDTEAPLNKGFYLLNPQSLSLLDAIQDADDSALYPLIELLLCYLGEHTAVPLKSSRDISLFSRSVDILYNNIDRRISVEELADSLRISLSHLKRIFAGLAGVGAHDYFNLLKVCKAKELLLDGVSVTATAEKTGFANQAYFSAAFKRITGVSPKDFAGKSVKHRPVSKAVKQSSKSKRDLPDYLL